MARRLDSGCPRRQGMGKRGNDRFGLGMELSGFEPLTSWVRSRRSPS
jgi:hypothetical protein